MQDTNRSGRGRGSSRGMGRGRGSGPDTGWSGTQRGATSGSTSNWSTSVWNDPSSSWGEPAGTGTADPWKSDSNTKPSSWATVNADQQSTSAVVSSWDSWTSNNVQSNSWTTGEQDLKNGTANSGWGQSDDSAGQWGSVGRSGGGGWGEPKESEGQVTEKAKVFHPYCFYLDVLRGYHDKKWVY